MACCKVGVGSSVGGGAVLGAGGCGDKYEGWRREERRSLLSGEGMWPVTVAIASEWGTCGSWMTKLGGSGLGSGVGS